MHSVKGMAADYPPYLNSKGLGILVWNAASLPQQAQTKNVGGFERKFRVVPVGHKFRQDSRRLWQVPCGLPGCLFRAAFGIGETGQRVLDLGTGAGTLARGFARRGCEVTALNPAAALLEEAKRLDREAGVCIEYLVATAEETGLPDGAFEVVGAAGSVAATCARRPAHHSPLRLDTATGQRGRGDRMPHRAPQPRVDPRRRDWALSSGLAL